MENLIFFHEHSIIVVILIIRIITFNFFILLINKFKNLLIIKGHALEIIWTILPIILLYFLALPSLKVLYLLNERILPLISVKVLGNQWYWTYQYDSLDFDFDSFILAEHEDKNFRLLDVDNNLVLPNKIQLRFLVSSNDVIHSFTVPALGFKIDATPGRLNKTISFIEAPGIFYGQCSEICGVNHRFIPIVVESINFNIFLKFLINHPY